MTFYRDLSPYGYRSGVSGALNVGWLGWRNPFFSRGRTSAPVVEELKRLATFGCGQTRGFHSCPFCFRSVGAPVIIDFGSQELALGSAEVSVEGIAGEKYIAPNLIIHYIERHSYRPPDVFLEALMSGIRGR